MRKKIGNLLDKVNGIIEWIDNMPLWFVGFIMLGIVLIPNFALGKGSVFTVHDQLDEAVMENVLTARHLGENIIPEMLGGISASGLIPGAVLFVPLYCTLPPFLAFMCSYALTLLCGFIGMYLAVRELTDSSILAVVSAGVFCMLSEYIVYGLSVMGVPIALYVFLCLYKGKNRLAALALTVFFGLVSHLVYTGYAVLGLWALALIVMFLRKERIYWSTVGFGVLLGSYLLTNYRLIGEILFGQGSYVSHREEMVNGALPFLESVKSVFLESAQHAPTYHGKLILPLVVMLVTEGIFYRRLCDMAAKRFRQGVCGMLLLIGIALFYGFCKWEPVVAWKNARTGFLHYFQMERFYWLYPAGWYLELALVFSGWWTQCREWRIVNRKAGGVADSLSAAYGGCLSYGGYRAETLLFLQKCESI